MMNGYLRYFRTISSKSNEFSYNFSRNVILGSCLDEAAHNGSCRSGLVIIIMTRRLLNWAWCPHAIAVGIFFFHSHYNTGELLISDFGILIDVFSRLKL